MRLDIESLRAFARVAEMGGVTRAADSLNLTQSAVSWKLKRLEQRLGRPILRRDGGRMAPTDDGRELLSYAQRILSAHDEALARFRPSELQGTVRLGVTEDVAASQLATVIARFARSHPDVSLSIRVEQSLVLSRWLADREIDLTVQQVLDQDVGDGDGVLWRDNLVWAGMDGGGLFRKASVPLVTFGPNCFYRPIATAALRQAGRAFEVILECPSAAGVMAAVAQGLGVAVVNRRNLKLAAAVETPDLTESPLPSIAYVVRTRTARPKNVERALAAEIRHAYGT
ncbi:MAG: LysR family transcriptional regulator [Kiloniellales bacterium]|jgi:DNA-binding transcriptional LysR family regulator